MGWAANSFFLLRMPRIKEIMGVKIENFKQHSANIEKIPFVDKN